VAKLLEDRAEYDRRSRIHNPYGDGQASQRIADRVKDFLD
jgi:UDP-N-acetylglucosamine 2-epimerase (non-hydrolysing)